jgi:hypothetical protein
MNHERKSRELVFQESTSNDVELKILKERVRDLETALREARAVADEADTVAALDKRQDAVEVLESALAGTGPART